MQAHSCLLLIVWTLSAVPSLLFKCTPEISTHLSRKTSTSPALCNSLRTGDTHPTAKRQWQNLSLKKKARLNNPVRLIFHRRICSFHPNPLHCSGRLSRDALNLIAPDLYFGLLLCDILIVMVFVNSICVASTSAICVHQLRSPPAQAPIDSGRTIATLSPKTRMAWH